MELMVVWIITVQPYFMTFIYFYSESFRCHLLLLWFYWHHLFFSSEGRRIVFQLAGLIRDPKQNKNVKGRDRTFDIELPTILIYFRIFFAKFYKNLIRKNILKSKKYFV